VEPERESIERGDFPRVADGLDPEAVAEHLREVADAVERLKREAGGSGADRVSRVVAAAEAAAAELEESARADADRTRADAAAELSRTREAVAGLADRANGLETQLEQLARSASAALAELTAAARAGAAEVGRPTPGGPTPGVPAAEEAPPKPKAEAPREPKPKAAPKAKPKTAPVPPPADVTASNGEAPASGEAPRLIAVNMALNGASRAEISRYLKDNFDLDDPGELLDEVWSRVNS
jgi:hypothetical protein